MKKSEIVYFIILSLIFTLSIIGWICSIVFFTSGKDLAGAISTTIAAISTIGILVTNHIYIPKQIKKEMEKRNEVSTYDKE